jgi:hypothetical protein
MWFTSGRGVSSVKGLSGMGLALVFLLGSEMFSVSFLLFPMRQPVLSIRSFAIKSNRAPGSNDKR